MYRVMRTARISKVLLLSGEPQMPGLKSFYAALPTNGNDPVQIRRGNFMAEQEGAEAAYQQSQPSTPPSARPKRLSASYDEAAGSQALRAS